MTTAPLDQSIAPVVPGLPGRIRTRRGVGIAVHSVCDYFSFVAVAMLPLLATHLGLTTGQKALLLGLGSVTSGLIQPVVAWLSDRWDSRKLSTIGLALAVVCVSNIGRAETFWQLLVLHGVGAMGIGAFHPPAAAAIGRMSGARRSLGMAIFFLAGMIGGIGGNLTAPRYVEWMARVVGTPEAPSYAGGLHALSWLMIPGLVACVVLGWAIHRTPHRHHAAHDHHAALSAAERRRRWTAVGVLYASNIIRFSVNMALVYLFVEWAEAHTLARAGVGALSNELGAQASRLNGPLQAGMQVGMGGVGLVLGFLLAPRFEKRAFVAFPLFGAVVIALMPFVDRLPASVVVAGAIVVSVLAGVGFGSVVPITLAAAQRLLPHRTSLASGMMLGGAWAFAFVGPQIAERVQRAVSLDAAFYTTAGMLALAAVLCAFLPGRLFADAIDHH